MSSLFQTERNLFRALLNKHLPGDPDLVDKLMNATAPTFKLNGTSLYPGFLICGEFYIAGVLVTTITLRSDQCYVTDGLITDHNTPEFWLCFLRDRAGIAGQIDQSGSPLDALYVKDGYLHVQGDECVTSYIHVPIDDKVQAQFQAFADWLAQR